MKKACKVSVYKGLLLIIVISIVAFYGCKKDEIDNKQTDKSDTIRVPTLLESLSEKDLTIPVGLCTYQDVKGNEDYTFTFDRDHVRHLFKINLEAGKNYRFTLLLECSDCDFLLLNSENDTISIGSEIIPYHQHIYYSPSISGIYYLSTRIISPINFKLFNSNLILEEVKIQEFSIDGFNFTCNGDWFISNKGYLGIAMHKSGVYDWAKLKTEIDSCRLTFEVSQASGFFKSAIGFSCFASDNLSELLNIPVKGYNFYIKGPGAWMYQHYGGTNNGEIPDNLPIGGSYWYNLGFDTDNKQISYLYNDEIMTTSSCDLTQKKFYLMVNESEKDTVYFKNFKLESTKRSI